MYDENLHYQSLQHNSYGTGEANSSAECLYDMQAPAQSAAEEKFTSCTPRSHNRQQHEIRKQNTYAVAENGYFEARVHAVLRIDIEFRIHRC